MLTPSSNNIPYFDTLYQIKSGTPSGEKLLNNNKMESKRRGGKVAKVAAKIKLLEWIYHMMRDSKTFKDTENYLNPR